MIKYGTLTFRIVWSVDTIQITFQKFWIDLYIHIHMWMITICFQLTFQGNQFIDCIPLGKFSMNSRRLEVLQAPVCLKKRHSGFDWTRLGTADSGMPGLAELGERGSPQRSPGRHTPAKRLLVTFSVNDLHVPALDPIFRLRRAHYGWNTWMRKKKGNDQTVMTGLSGPRCGVRKWPTIATIVVVLTGWRDLWWWYNWDKESILHVL